MEKDCRQQMLDFSLYSTVQCKAAIYNATNSAWLVSSIGDDKQSGVCGDISM